jgi:hypothetical protein
VLGFSQQEGNRGGNTWWVLVAGEKTDEGLATWRGAAEAAEWVSEEREGERTQVAASRGKP